MAYDADEKFQFLYFTKLVTFSPNFHSPSFHQTCLNTFYVNLCDRSPQKRLINVLFALAFNVLAAYEKTVYFVFKRQKNDSVILKLVF